MTAPSLFLTSFCRSSCGGDGGEDIWAPYSEVRHSLFSACREKLARKA